jgi:putative membrane protein
MLRQLFYFLVMAGAMMALSMSGVLPGFRVDGFQAALLGAVVLALANALLMPVLFLLTLPITVLTVGLFLLVLNGLMLWITARIVPGLHLRDAFTTVAASVILSLVGTFWNALFKDDKRRKRDRE